jgi:hypothetical protein
VTRAEAQAIRDNFRLAQDIVDSDPVIRVYASCEWRELSDDGKVWIAAIVAEARRRTAEELAPRKRFRGNLRPAPFALTPSMVVSVLDSARGSNPGVVDVPLAPTRLVNIPRCSEDPSLAKANDDTPFPTPSARTDGGIEPARVAPKQAEKSAPAGSPNPGRPDDAGGENEQAVKGACHVDHTEERAARRRNDRALAGHSDSRGGPGRARCEDRATGPVHGSARRADSRRNQAPAIEGRSDRLAQIREAAANLARRDALAAGRTPRIPLGQRAESKSLKLPPLPAERRRAVLGAAIAFLKRKCVLVTPTDRGAQIRKYRVSGKREAMLAEDVIEFAIGHGFEVPA